MRQVAGEKTADKMIKKGLEDWEGGAKLGAGQGILQSARYNNSPDESGAVWVVLVPSDYSCSGSASRSAARFRSAISLTISAWRASLRKHFLR